MCTSFMLACYKSSCTFLTGAQVKQSTSSALTSQILLSTTEAFWEIVACAHLQVTIWKCVLYLYPVDLNPTDFGRSKGIHTGSHAVTTVPVGT